MAQLTVRENFTIPDGKVKYPQCVALSSQPGPGRQSRIHSAGEDGMHDRPAWLRVYELQSAGAPNLLKDLRPIRETSTLTEYLDVDRNMLTTSARIYLFSRASPLHRNSRPVDAAGKAA
jgi:hypothetical protein